MTVVSMPVETMHVDVAGGSAEVSRVAAADDVIAPPANGVELAERLGDRVELHVVDGAGHALLPSDQRSSHGC